MQENLEKRLKRQIHGKLHRFTAIAPLGFEETLVKELRQIGVAAENDSFETADGKVTFTAKITEVWKAVAHSRITNRMLMDIASFKAENFRELEKKAAEIPWELFLPQDVAPITPDTVPVHVTCKHSRLYHSDAVAERFYDVLGFNTPTQAETVTQHLYVEFLKDRCTVSLDLAGEELYKRGHQRFVAEAPLKETIAAAMLLEAISASQDTSHITHSTSQIIIVDPMAGSGTFSLEAAYKSCGLIPGRCRDFALKHQPAFKEASWNYILSEKTKTKDNVERHPERPSVAKDPGPNPTFHIITSDISERAVEIIKHNVQTSPLPPGTIDPQQKDFFTYTSEDIFGGSTPTGSSKAILLLNPPYGKRLDTNAPALYARIGKKLTELARGAKAPIAVAILAPKGACSENLLKNCPALATPETKAIKTSHGGISLNCFVSIL
jgi:putative N6-adenine-specific DNA methylase